MPRAKTVEEAREEFLHHLRGLAAYWSEVPNQTIRERCDGLVFSILNIFDGTSAGFPAMNIALAPHKDDQAFNEAEGENWYESGMIINDCYLHEMYFKK